MSLSAFYRREGRWFNATVYPWESHAAIFLALVDPTTGYMLGCQTGVIVGCEGVVHTTMKHPSLQTDGTRAIWREFRWLCLLLGAYFLTAEMPPKLAQHYLDTYDGLERAPQAGHYGRSILTCQLREEGTMLGSKKFRQTEFYVWSSLLGSLIALHFGIDPTLIGNYWIGSGLAMCGANIAHGLADAASLTAGIQKLKG